ncbi:MAG: BON domain-containing protein [Ramlibacter sp.]
MKQVLSLTAAFAAGAAAVLLLDQAVCAKARRPQSDSELREHVRERLGELVSHPGFIQVDVDNMVVRLTGEVLSHELDGLLSHLTHLPGVRKVHNALTVLSDPQAFSAQEPRRPAAEPSDKTALPEWTPAI